MARYTYEEVEKKLKDHGLYMSDDDLKLAKQNPDAGMSIVNYKIDYNNASDDAGRAAANQGAERIRTQYGNYTAGGAGDKYYAGDPTPSSFSSGYTKDVGSAYEKVKNYGDYTYDAFEDKYAGERARLLEAIANPKEFSYDYSDDPNYKSYAKQYRREGDRAMEDALAKAAANTGGVASSAAVTAAAQQGNYYASQLADKIPALYDAAYQRYLDEYTMKQNAYNAYQGETAADYDRYVNERNFSKQLYDDKYSRLVNALNTAQALEQVDYNRNIDNLNYADAQKSRALSNAYAAAELGDFSQLEALGIDTKAYQQQLAEARALEKESAALNNQYITAQLAHLKNKTATDARNNAISEAELKAAMGDYTDLARLLGVTEEEVKAAYAKAPEVDPLMTQAQYIRTMLMLDGSYKNIPSVEDIAVLLANGFTGFDEILNGGGVPVAGMTLPTTAPIPGIEDSFRVGNVSSSATPVDSKDAFTDYDSVQDERMLSEEEWTRAKLAGNTSGAIAGFNTYEDYVSAYRAAMMGK